jgi:hypothetical protein
MSRQCDPVLKFRDHGHSVKAFAVPRPALGYEDR